ncbi:MAG: sulfite exporter TauE/SafE family protein [Alicyclobacillaceae bacterium]|nr:sulfite exporter TauE/SafE family protein [Alicyclobacillaceae bacterium]
MEIWLFMVLAGFLASLIGSLAGLGGGFLIVPILVTLFHYEPRLVAGTTLAVIAATSISSVVAYMKQKNTDYWSGSLFALASIPGAIWGAVQSSFLHSRLFFILFGLNMLLVSLLLLFRPQQRVRLPLPATTERRFRGATGEDIFYAYNLPFALVVSLGVGILGGLLGIGGGSIMVPTMMIFLNFPPHVAVATSMYTIFLTSLAAAGTHAVLGNILWGHAAWLSVGALAGAQVGPRLARRLSSVWLVRVFGVVLILVAVQMIIS